MKAILDRSQWSPISLIFVPPIVILDFSSTSINLKIPCKIELFPAPVRPMIPTLVEGEKYHDTKIKLNILDEVSVLLLALVEGEIYISLIHFQI